MVSFVRAGLVDSGCASGRGRFGGPGRLRCGLYASPMGLSSPRTAQISTVGAKKAVHRLQGRKRDERSAHVGDGVPPQVARHPTATPL